jgi:hypothetical protein
MKQNVNLQLTKYATKKAKAGLLKTLSNGSSIENANFDSLYLIYSQDNDLTEEELKNIRYIAGQIKGSSNSQSNPNYAYISNFVTNSSMDVYNSKIYTPNTDFVIKNNIPKDKSLNDFNLISVVNKHNDINNLNDVFIASINYTSINTDTLNISHLQNYMGYNNTTSLCIDRTNKKIYLLVCSNSGEYKLYLYIFDLYTRALLDTKDLSTVFPNIMNFKIFVENNILFINEYTLHHLKSYDLINSVQLLNKDYTPNLHSTTSGNIKSIISWDYKTKKKYIIQFTNDRDSVTNRQNVYLHELDVDFNIVNTIQQDFDTTYGVDEVYIEDLDRKTYYVKESSNVYLNINGVKTYKFNTDCNNFYICNDTNLFAYTYSRNIYISSLPVSFAFAKIPTVVHKEIEEDINVNIRVKVQDNDYFLFE